jgi:lipopolysaccharide cholinephosphotransferase
MASPVKLTGKYALMANKMLREVSALLYEYKIPYVLEAGTLLGIVREDRLLPWDNDVDITITSNHLEQLLKQRWKFFFHGYRLRIRTYKRDIGPFKKGMVRLIKVSLLKYHLFKQVNLLDIFVKYPVGGKYLWTLGVKKAVLKGAPKRFYDEHTELEYKGRKYTVPKDYEGYLEYHYGDWKTPVKEWDFRTSDNCVKELFYDQKKPLE